MHVYIHEETKPQNVKDHSDVDHHKVSMRMTSLVTLNDINNVVYILHELGHLTLNS